MPTLILACLLFLLTLDTVRADFTDSLNLRSSGMGTWVRVVEVTWRFDTADYSRRKVQLDLTLMVGNGEKQPITVGTGMCILRLAKNDRAIFLNAMGSMKYVVTQKQQIAPGDSTVVGASFVLPDTGTSVELKFTPLGASQSVWLTFLPQVLSPCRQIARRMDLFLFATTGYKRFLSTRKINEFYGPGNLYLQAGREDVNAACASATTSDLDVVSRFSSLAVSEDTRGNITDGNEDAIAALQATLSEAEIAASRIRLACGRGPCLRKP